MSAGIPPLYHDADVSDWDDAEPKKRRAFAAVLEAMGDPDAVLGAPRSCILSGPPGTGKTRAAIAIGKRWDAAGRSWSYLPFDDLGRRVRATYSNADETEADIVAGLAKWSLLMIDDVGAVTVTDFVRGLLHTVIDARYRAMLPTLIATNLTAAELPAAIGERAIDRLREGGGKVIVFPGPSLRGSVMPTRSVEPPFLGRSDEL